eukprot:jgi/Undpi1/3972/HiC_scaffold_16.g07340.m1
MFASGRTKKRDRGSAAPPTSNTLGGRHKRHAKSSGSPFSSIRLSAGQRTAALSIDPTEAGIVLDRLRKEVVSLLEAGGRTRDRVRRRLRMGINEVTKFLETTAASSGSNDCSNTSSRNDGGGGGSGGSGGSGGGEAIVIISGDVRPTRLVEHLHALVALTGTPCLVLPGGTSSSSTLGRMLGCKTMAAFAICAAPTPAPTPPPPSAPPDNGTTSETLDETMPSSGKDESRIGSENGGVVGMRVGAGGAGPEAGGGEGGGRGEAGGGRGGGEPVVDNLAAVDEDVDSFVQFLRRKVRVPP